MSLAESLPIKVVVNADDFGLSKSVNAAIVAGLDCGHITSTTVLANGNAFDEAVELALQRSHISYGAHLNFTEFAPVTKNTQLSAALLNGEFHKQSLQSLSGRSLKNAVLEEFMGQIERIRASGVKVSHLDSHHHIHTQPAMIFVLRNLRSLSQVGYVRNTRNLYSNTEIGLLPRLKKKIWTYSQSLFLPSPIKYFGSLMDFLKNYDKVKPGDCAEIMVHPGHERYEAETEILMTRWWESLPVKIDFISYDDVSQND